MNRVVWNRRPARGQMRMPDRPARYVVQGFEGMGDTAYMRPVIRAFARRVGGAYVRTPWPEFFWDCPEVMPVKPPVLTYRSQAANTQRADQSQWYVEPWNLAEARCGYDMRVINERHSVLSACANSLAVPEVDLGPFHLPVNPAWERDWECGDIPPQLALVHPPVVRAEWRCPARNPRMEYVQACMDARPDLSWVSVGWLEQTVEWIDGPEPRGLAGRLDGGELVPVSQLLWLLSRARIALCGPSFLLSVAAALGVPVFCVFGGFMSPGCLIDPRMGERVGHVAPEPFCHCMVVDHACNREIGAGRAAAAFRAFADRWAPPAKP
jgi:hypothetical protein